MERILVPVDGSRSSIRAAQHAAKLARALGADEVCVLNIQPDISAWQVHGLSRDVVASRCAGLAAHAMQAPAAVLARQGIQVKSEYRHAVDIASAIVEVARERHSTQIVMGKDGRSGAHPGTAESVAQKVLRLASVPVSFVR